MILSIAESAQELMVAWQGIRAPSGLLAESEAALEDALLEVGSRSRQRCSSAELLVLPDPYIGTDLGRLALLVQVDRRSSRIPVLLR